MRLLPVCMRWRAAFLIERPIGDRRSPVDRGSQGATGVGEYFRCIAKYIY